MPDPVTPSLDELVREATADGTIASAAIFVMPPSSSSLELAAASGIEGAALAGLVAAVANPQHPVARSVADGGPTFDVLPVNPGGPRLRSHLPLVAVRHGRRVVVGVLALAHDQPLTDEDRGRLARLAERAAAAVRA